MRTLRGEPSTQEIARPLRVGERIEIRAASPIHRHAYVCTVLSWAEKELHLTMPVHQGRLVFLPVGTDLTVSVPDDPSSTQPAVVVERRSGPDRRLILRIREARAAVLRQLPGRALAISSGKGGVGKSVIALNLAVVLGKLGRKVVLIDGDLGTPNLAVLLSLRPSRSLEDVAAGRCAAQEALVAGPEGIRLLAGALDGSRASGLSDQELATLIRALSALPGGVDFFVIDTGAGLGGQVTQLISLATELLLVTTPEPTAIIDAFALLKVLAQAQRTRPRTGLIVNMAQSESEAQRIARKIRYAADRFLAMQVDALGAVPLHGTVPRAIRRHETLFTAAKSGPAAMAIREIARRLVEAPIASNHRATAH